MPGDVLEDYEILERIGGNMGLVFKARHRLLDKVVALKLLPAEWMHDKERLGRFQREMRILGQLAHPNLVTAADAREADSWHLVAMEWIDGVDLQRLARSEVPLSVADACEAARQAALGLQYAHEHGLIHRDIKPSNLMLTRSGEIKVIDLGLALAHGETTATLTRTGQVMGTLAYCPPEQFYDASRADGRADIYGLGCTLYHLLTGRAPYGGQKTSAELMQAHLNEPFPTLASGRPGAPAGLEAVLARMTAKDPKARFATAGEAAAALKPFTDGADLQRLCLALPSGDCPEETPADRPNRRPIRGKRVGDTKPRRWALGRKMAASFALMAAVIAMALVIPGHDPVVVSIDTTSHDGVYDPDNRVLGGSNAKEVFKVLTRDNFLPQSSLHQEPVDAEWGRESSVIALRPDLVVIHRSSFHHSYNAVFRFGDTNQFLNPTNDPKWNFLYHNVGDERLISLLAMIGNEVPKTKFLVYSRGTDASWLNDDDRARWVQRIESRFPKLKGRIATMVIPNEKMGTFRDPMTADLLRQKVRELLKLPRRSGVTGHSKDTSATRGGVPPAVQANP